MMCMHSDALRPGRNSGRGVLCLAVVPCGGSGLGAMTRAYNREIEIEWPCVGGGKCCPIWIEIGSFRLL